MSTSRSGVAAGSTNAAARVTTPRMPAHDTTVVSRGVSASGSSRSRSIAAVAKTQAKRMTTTAANTPRAPRPMRVALRSLLPTADTMGRISRPISRNTTPSSRNVMVDQLDWANRRAGADCSRSALWPRMSPAMTTASTPDAWISSASRYAANGVTSEMAVRVTVSATWAWTLAMTRATSRPTPRPPTTEMAKSRVISIAVMWPSMAVVAAVRHTRAVASLTRLSPSSTVTTRLGRPTRRAMVVAATASGGATTAPMASAAAAEMGSSQAATAPTPSVVAMTNPTDRDPMTGSLLRKSMSEVRTAAAYSSGGSSPTRTMSGSRWKSSKRGRNDPAQPMSSSISGIDRFHRRAAPPAAVTTTTTRIRSSADSIARSWRNRPVIPPGLR